MLEDTKSEMTKCRWTNLFIILFYCLAINFKFNFSQYIDFYNNKKHPVEVSLDYLKWTEFQQKQLLSFKENNSINKNIDNNNNNSNNVNNSNFIVTTTKTKINYSNPLNLNFVSNKSNTNLFNTFNIENNLNTTNNDSIAIKNSTRVSRLVYPVSVATILGLLTILVSLITVVGNILVLISFIVERALRVASNYFLASLAVTDILIGLFSMNFYTLYLILGRWPLGRLSCDLWLSLDYTACLTSQYTVLLITIDRFCSVHLPAKYRIWRTDSKILILVAVTWIVPSVVFFTTIMGWPYFSTKNQPRPLDQCYAEFSSDPIFNTIFTVCYFWVTLCVMINLYVDIYRVAVDLQKRSDEKHNRVSGLIKSNHENHANLNKPSIQQNTTEFKTTLNSLSTNQLKMSKSMEIAKLKKNSITQLNNSSCCLNKESSDFSSNKVNYSTVIITTSTNNQPNSNNPKSSLYRNVEPRTENNQNVDVILLSLGLNHNNLKHQDNVFTYPTSVKLLTNNGLIIDSPILKEEDSSLEIIDTSKFNKIGPPSSVDPVEEKNNSEKSSLKSNLTKTISESNLKQNNLKKLEIKLECTEQSDLDFEYQNKVLKQYKEKLKVFENENVQTQSLSNYTNSNRCNLLFNISTTSESPSSNNQIKYPNNHNMYDYSPIWKSNKSLYNYEGLTSGNCSIESYQCHHLYGCHMDLHKCVFCAKNNDSFTSQSSSSCGICNWNNNIYNQTCTCYLLKTYQNNCLDRNKINLKLNPKIYNHRYNLYRFFNKFKFKNLFCKMIKFDCLSNLRLAKLNQLLFQLKQRLLVFNQPKKTIVERSRRENRARKALRTITFILGAFVICWTPYHVVIIIKGICDNMEENKTCVNDLFYSVTYWLCYMNSPINPFCYALANAQFKKTFLRILKGDLKKT